MSNSQTSRLPYEEMTDYAKRSRLTAEDMADLMMENQDLSIIDSNLQAAEALLKTSNTLLNVANNMVNGDESPEVYMENARNEIIPEMEKILGNTQQFRVPYNPLSPPEYAEILDYASLQYLNGFLRTQIGMYVRIVSIRGSNDTVENYGYLIGVGLNYILLQNFPTGNITSIDFYSIKSVYYYYEASPVDQFRGFTEVAVKET